MTVIKYSHKHKEHGEGGYTEERGAYLPVLQGGGRLFMEG